MKKDKMMGYSGYSDKKMMGSKGYSNKDWQPGEKQFAGKVAGTANEYMERTDATMNKAAAKVKSQEYKGRYD